MGGSKSKPVGTIVIVGLDAAGKSTVINFLKADKDKSIEIPPTVGFSSEQVRYNGKLFTCFDMSGAKQYRPLWEQNLDRESCEGVIFVVDSTDTLRMCVIESELSQLVNVIPQDVPVVFLANKCDQGDAVQSEIIADKLNLKTTLNLHKWRIYQSSAVRGDGIKDAMNWLITNMPTKLKKK